MVLKETESFRFKVYGYKLKTNYEGKEWRLMVRTETSAECKERKGTPAEHWLGNNHLVDYPYTFKLCSQIGNNVYPYWCHELRATLSFGERTSIFKKGKIRYCTIVPFDDESAVEVLDSLLSGGSPSQPSLL